MTRFSTRLIIAAVAAFTLPVAASAAPKPEAPQETSAPATAAPSTQRYCIVDTPTGSRLERRECRTLDAWLDRGVDPRETK